MLSVALPIGQRSVPGLRGEGRRGGGPVHSESASPNRSHLAQLSFRTHTVTDGPRSVEAVVTQPEHDPSAVLQNKLGLEKDSLT